MSIAKDFNKQITEMQNQFRKYYIDTYLDLQHKEDEDLIAEGNNIHNTNNITNKNTQQNTIIYDNTENIDRRETSTRDSVLKIQEWKKEQFKKQYEESLKKGKDTN